MNQRSLVSLKWAAVPCRPHWTPWLWLLKFWVSSWPPFALDKSGRDPNNWFHKSSLASLKRKLNICVLLESLPRYVPQSTRLTTAICFGTNRSNSLSFSLVDSSYRWEPLTSRSCLIQVCKLYPSTCISFPCFIFLHSFLSPADILYILNFIVSLPQLQCVQWGKHFFLLIFIYFFTLLAPNNQIRVWSIYQEMKYVLNGRNDWRQKGIFRGTYNLYYWRIVIPNDQYIT